MLSTNVYTTSRLTALAAGAEEEEAAMLLCC